MLFAVYSNSGRKMHRVELMQRSVIDKVSGTSAPQCNIHSKSEAEK
jgi:hypothetical protein